MSKYIIKNCENYDPFLQEPTCNKYPCDCQTKTDCKLKQIVENLRQVAYAGHCDNCDGCGYYNGCSDTECGTYQALKSLELLGIIDQEREENNKIKRSECPYGGIDCAWCGEECE